jgi:hypothetical protein
MTSSNSPAPATDRYRQGMPVIDLYIERGTERVPADGGYHVLHEGELVGSFRSLRAAQRDYHHRQETLGYSPPPCVLPSIEERLRNEDLERDLMRSASYWAESHRFGGGGGKLRHR